VYHVKLLKRTCRVFSSSPGQTHSRENPLTSNNYDYSIYIYNIPEDIVYETTEGGCMITVTSYTDIKVTKRVDRKK
jgi:hypothetical protein